MLVQELKSKRDIVKLTTSFLVRCVPAVVSVIADFVRIYTTLVPTFELVSFT